MASYSFEKGKYGGPTGTIFPFFRHVNGNLPSLTKIMKTLCPAGYLKCNGQILSADQFPQLAEFWVLVTLVFTKKKASHFK